MTQESETPQAGETASLKTHIAGPNFRRGALARLEELSQAFEAAADTDDYEFKLEREPTNKFDPYAVKVLDPNWDDPGGASGFIGYVPKDWSYEVARILDGGGEALCYYAGKHKIVINLRERSAEQLAGDDEAGVDTGTSGQ